MLIDIQFFEVKENIEVINLRDKTHFVPKHTQNKKYLIFDSDQSKIFWSREENQEVQITKAVAPNSGGIGGNDKVAFDVNLLGEMNKNI